MLADLHAAEKEKLDGRCTGCWNAAAKMHQDLQDAIDAYEEVRLHKTIEGCKNEHNQLEITFLNKCQ